MLTAESENTLRLVADVGGTNARFALVRGPHGLPEQEKTLPTANYPALTEAARDYLLQVGSKQPIEAAVAIANPITGNWVKMTNCHWAFSVESTRHELKLARLLLLNDFTALALSLPKIPENQLEQVGGGAPVANTPLGLIGPGTGLGVSGLIPSGNEWIPLQGEGGHVTLCAVSQREADIIAFTQRQYPHVSAERLISGMGLENLYRAIATLEKNEPKMLTAAQIVERALSAQDSFCVDALETFCGMLGTVAGNLAVTLGSLGGVYIGGGIVTRLGDYFARSPFRARFEAKGRFEAYLAAIPTYVIRASNPALLGAAMSLGVNPRASTETAILK